MRKTTKIVAKPTRVEFLTDRLATLRGKLRDARKAGRSTDAIEARIERRNGQLVEARAKAKAAAKAERVAAKPAKTAKRAAKVAA